MLKRIFCAGCLYLTSMASQAGLISHYGYERVDSSNIVKGGGLEWLKWDVTTGKSISEALSLHSSAGWVLASNTQMAILFNAFQFGSTNWSNDENLQHYTYADWTVDENSRHNEFASLFGRTNPEIHPVCSTTITTQCFSATDGVTYVSAFYGSDYDKDQLFNQAVVFDDYTYTRYSGNQDRYFSYAWLSTDSEWINVDPTQYTKDTWVGVALVRTPSESVNAPVSFSLFALGLIALGFRRYQALVR